MKQRSGMGMKDRLGLMGKSNRYRAPARRSVAGRSSGTGAFLGKVLVRLGRLAFSGVFAAALVLSLSVGLVMGYRYLLSSDYFTVRKVVLSGLSRVTREDVLWRTGLDRPANVLSLRLSAMAAAVRGIPWVQDVTVTRQLPDTIVISVQERRVRALVSLDRLYYVDDQGVPFKAVEPEERPNLPVITGFSRADLTERRDRNRRDLDELFALLEVLAERNDQFRLENASELNYDPVRGMTLFTREERIQVKVGLGDYRAKFKRLGRVMAHLKIGGQADGVSYVNLESSPRVVVRKAAADEGRGA